jgi:hypothetical protein
LKRKRRRRRNEAFAKFYFIPPVARTAASANQRPALVTESLASNAAEQSFEDVKNQPIETQLLRPPFYSVVFSLFSATTTRAHDAEAISGTLGSADGQADQPYRSNFRDVEQETGGGPADHW